ncbi:PF06250 domain protein [Leptospira borgpetersenii serovar Pomona str. 200901868]|uniref:PF06250 domain protein n=1 Tax=Leptospira borgpetersenii serovar Pomona str. 200901868 TaxID=1192866 RepID=M6WAU7_LEPBO|nr:PF06250 domain protein [Leptospira borgpetersenii serovar Pomona str. 200901868]
MNREKINQALNGILKVYEEIRSQSSLNKNTVVLEANREIGRILKDTEKDATNEERRSGSWMKAISFQLQKHLKKGFSERNLFYAQKFYEVYGKSELDHRLSWSHYRKLASIVDEKLREKLTQAAIQKGWSEKDLSIKVKESGQQRRSPELRWKRPEGLLWRYKIKESLTTNESFLLDLGFYCYYEIPQTQAGNKYKTDDILEIHKQGKSWNIKKTKIPKSSDLYFYFGEIERIIDGDTILVKLQLGFNVIARQRIRLHNVWSGELDTDEGASSFELLKKKLPSKTKIIVRSRSKDIYGRYVGDVLYLPKKAIKPEEILKDGIYLNEELSKIGGF